MLSFFMCWFWLLCRSRRQRRSERFQQSSGKRYDLRERIESAKSLFAISAERIISIGFFTFSTVGRRRDSQDLAGARVGE
jgi:hypothetical protein